MDFAQADALNQAIRLLSLRHRARAAALVAPLGLHPGQEALLLELARTGPRIQAQLGEALGVEPPSVTLMARKLESSGHIRRTQAPSDKRASIVELTDSGRELAEKVKELWQGLAEETVAGLPDAAVAELPGLLSAMTANVDPRRASRGFARSVESDQVDGLRGEFEPSALPWVREHVDQVMRTGTTDGVTIQGLPTVLMTYRGAKTGRLRKTPLMRVEHAGRYAAVGSNGGEPADPRWVAALEAQPVAGIQDGTAHGVFRARRLSGDEKELWWRRAVDAYPEYAAYQRKTDRDIPVFVLAPVRAPARLSG